MQWPSGKLSAPDALPSQMQICSASKEIAQLTLRNIACRRDRDQDRNRIIQLESELQLLKQQNELLTKQIRVEQQYRKQQHEEHQCLRQKLFEPDGGLDNNIKTDLDQFIHDRKISPVPLFDKESGTARDMQTWAQLRQIASSVDPLLVKGLEEDLSVSAIELISNLARELTMARTETRDLIYKVKHSEATLSSVSSELSGLKKKLSRARAEQCLALACNVALRRTLSKQQIAMRNVEDTMRRMKALQDKRHAG